MIWVLCGLLTAWAIVFGVVVFIDARPLEIGDEDWY